MQQEEREGTRREERLGPATKAPFGGGVCRSRGIGVQRLDAGNVDHMALTCQTVPFFVITFYLPL